MNDERQACGDGRLAKMVEHRIGVEPCRGCGEPSQRTIDYDVFGAPDWVYACHKCAPVIIERIEGDLAKIGRNTVIGQNGGGREWAKGSIQNTESTGD